MSSFAEAQYDILWVLDATIAVQPGALGRMVDAFVNSPSPHFEFNHDLESTALLSDDVRGAPTAGDVGLVHQVPVAVVGLVHQVPFAAAQRKTWGSLIEQAFLNTTHAKMYLAIVSVSSCLDPS
jgi:ceramide glucosyltransferase